MSGTAIARPSEDRAFQRWIGTWDCGIPGPTVLVLSGIHGNEPAGVFAMQALLQRMRVAKVPIRGRVVALAGNLRALSERRRFLDRDLNRRWLPRSVLDLQARDPSTDDAEDREQRELLEMFAETEQTCTGPILFLDLHTSSAEGPPFTCIADTRHNRRLALSVPVPLILGLEECIDGAVMEYFNQRGIANVAVEGGRHDAPETVENLEAAVWLLLEAAGMLRDADVDLAPYRVRLRTAARGLPAVVEIRHRHVIGPGDAFTMEPGFASFQPVTKGVLMARDQRGELRAGENARVLLPLYQGQGEDGYFLCRDVRPFWLRVASVLRQLQVDRIAHWLPGVRRSPEDRHTLLVRPVLARWFVPEVLHLLGFRRRRMVDGLMRFTRRWSRPENRELRPS